MSSGIYLSKEGENADSKDVIDYIHNSDFEALKIFKQGAVDLTITTAGIKQATINHSLGYSPLFFHYVMVDPDNPTNRFLGRFIAETGNYIGVDSYIDRTKLVIAWSDDSAGGFTPYPYTVSFYYYIFSNRLE